MPGLLRAVVSKSPMFDSRAVDAAVREELDRIGRETRRALSIYPPQQRGRRHTFTSERERRTFFYKLRRGLISVPYQRTGELAATWFAEVIPAAGGIALRITNRLRYAGFVQGAGTGGTTRQTADMRARGWKTVTSVFGDQWYNGMRRMRRAFERAQRG